MSDVTILPVAFGPASVTAQGNGLAVDGSASCFNIVLPRGLTDASKGDGRASKIRQGRAPEAPPNQVNLDSATHSRPRKANKVSPAMERPLPTRSAGVLYVGRTEGEMITVLGKVGMSQDSLSVIRRAESFKASDRIFEFVLEAAFEVTLPAGTVMKRVEEAVLFELEQGGLERYGENFIVPGGHMPFLANLAAKALTRLGHSFVPLDIQEHRQEAIDRNSRTWARLRNRPSGEGRDLYQDWLQDHCSPPHSWAGFQRRSQYLRGVYALGYLMRDLAAGSRLQSLEIPLPDNGTLIIYPSSLKAAQFEYQAEVDLHLADTESFYARFSSQDQLPTSSNALRVILGDTFEDLALQNVFLPPTRSRPDMVQFSPEHVAALGLLGGRYREACLWEGLGVRAQVPIHLHRTIQAHPEHLPAFRFWAGVKHFSHLHVRLQDFPLPDWAGILWSDGLTQAAGLLGEAGFPIPSSVQDYVAHAWIPGHRGHCKQPERWVV